jgi:F0F1-type ATP synthase membrane subunit c/vacuolar-type H+-ATPase subunit K
VILRTLINKTMRRKSISAVISIFLISLFVLGSEVYAQVDSSGFATSVPMKQSAEAGDIICSYEQGFSKCNSLADPAMYGVVVDNVSVSVEDTELENSTLAITTGVATVKVTASEGPIAEGDFVTSSEQEGVGQLATQNGYVLGTAMESYDASDVGTIQVALNIHPASGLTGPGSNLLQFIRKGVTIPLFEPLESLRYILAVLMILISFTLGMIYFGRSSRTGIEAIGRNPLAKRVIQFTVVLNIVLTVVIVLVGLAIAYLILIL